MTTIRKVITSRSLRSPSSFRVYANDPARQLADDFYNRHKIQSLRYKSKVWGRAGRLATRAEIAELRPALARFFSCKEDEIQLAFSVYAGCSCGCSPGYVGRVASGRAITSPGGAVLNRADIWADVEISPEARRDVIEGLAKLEPDMEREIAEQSANAARPSLKP